MSAFSKQAVWLAVNSEHGDRLVEIAQEHTRLARELVVNGDWISDQNKEIYAARIDQLRKERDAILVQFEGR